MEVCSLEAYPRIHATGSARLNNRKAGNWKLETGSWKLETGNWKLETGN
jgi:hypothetical protein